MIVVALVVNKIVIFIEYQLKLKLKLKYDDFQLGNFTLYRFASPKPNFWKKSRFTAVPDMTPEPGLFTPTINYCAVNAIHPAIPSQHVSSNFRTFSHRTKYGLVKLRQQDYCTI